MPGSFYYLGLEKMTASTNQGQESFEPEVSSFLIGYYCEGLNYFPLPAPPPTGAEPGSASDADLCLRALADALASTDTKPGAARQSFGLPFNRRKTDRRR